MTLTIALPAGEIIERVPCESDKSQSYALYLPSNYTPERKWPILLALDAGARGSLPLRVFRPAAEEYGYILAGSNNSKNGPMDLALASLVKMWQDTKTRLSVDSTRVSLAGFSGGVRVAGRFAQLSGVSVDAVIGCGAGFDLEESTAEIPFVFVGTCGIRDMNYLWLQTLNATLLKRKASSRVILFEGEHHWPPAEICRQAMQWVELASYRRGRRPLDNQLVEGLYQSERSRAWELEEARRYFQAYLVQLDLRSDFEGIHDLDEVRNSIKLVAGTDRLRDSWKAEQALEQEESRYLKEILAEFLDTERRRTSEWWEKKIKKVGEIGKWAPDLDHQLMAERVQDSLWRNGYERAWLASLSQDYETAVYFAEIAAMAQPESSEVLYNLARMYAFNRQQGQAITTLRTAARLGLKIGPRIKGDEAFNGLRQLPELKSILEAENETDPEE